VSRYRFVPSTPEYECRELFIWQSAEWRPEIQFSWNKFLFYLRAYSTAQMLIINLNEQKMETKRTHAHKRHNKATWIIFTIITILVQSRYHTQWEKGRMYE
jgi:hypothetical protein